MRLLNTSGKTVGAGALVGPREILTCAHVVNAALGRDSRAQDQPPGDVTVELGERRKQARVQRYRQQSSQPR